MKCGSVLKLHVEKAQRILSSASVGKGCVSARCRRRYNESTKSLIKSSKQTFRVNLLNAGIRISDWLLLVKKEC